MQKNSGRISFSALHHRPSHHFSQYQTRCTIPDYRKIPVGFQFQQTFERNLHFAEALPNFAKARPIVNYSRSWPKQMGFVSSIVLQDILKVVYTSALCHHNICSVMKEIAYVFHSVCQWLRLVFTANWHWWIYNQVEHERILQSIEFAVQRYIVPAWSTFESLWQAQRKEYYEFSEDSGVRRLKMYRSLRVGDIVPNL
jgi:hypothetical protein